MQWCPDRGHVVGEGEEIPHQPHGAESSFLGTAGLCRAEKQGLHPNPHQRHNCNCISEQERGHTHSEALRLGNSSVGDVSDQESNDPSRAHPRQREQEGRRY